MTTMQAMAGRMIDTAKQSILLALFNKLDETDKDVVIQLSESLVTKHRNYINAPLVQMHNYSLPNGRMKRRI